MDISTIEETTTITRNVRHQPSSDVASRLKRTERSSFISGNYRVIYLENDKISRYIPEDSKECGSSSSQLTPANKCRFSQLRHYKMSTGDNPVDSYNGNYCVAIIIIACSQFYPANTVLGIPEMC